jgi:putative ABC transport system substrate-binding protein
MMGLTLAFTIILLLGGLFSTVPADAQDAAKVPRIGFLGADTASGAAGKPMREAFFQGLSDLGYVEGRNLVMEYRWAEAKFDRFPALAAELVALNVDVIFAAGGTPAALAAKQATHTIPIVAFLSDPVATGLVASFARPGGNVTGLSFMTPELVAKHMELLKEAVPRVSRVAVLWHPSGMSANQGKAMLKAAEGAARALGVRLHVVEARAPDDLDRAFSEMTRGRAQALTVLTSTMFVQERTRLADLAAKSGLAAVYPFRQVVEAGGLMSYGPNVPDLYRRAATYVAKILRGAKPGELPVEQPTKFELVINLKAAKALGLTIPASLLARADKVIEK